MDAQGLLNGVDGRSVLAGESQGLVEGHAIPVEVPRQALDAPKSTSDGQLVDSSNGQSAGFAGGDLGHVVKQIRVVALHVNKKLFPRETL